LWWTWLPPSLLEPKLSPVLLLSALLESEPSWSFAESRLPWLLLAESWRWSLSSLLLSPLVNAEFRLRRRHSTSEQMESP
jgi:hypothetical protein